MTKFTVELTEDEVLALSLDMLDPKEWARNAIKAKAATLVQETTKAHVERCLANAWPLPTSTSEMLADAIAKNTVRTAAQREADFLAEMESRRAAAEQAEAETKPE